VEGGEFKTTRVTKREKSDLGPAFEMNGEEEED